MSDENKQEHSPIFSDPVNGVYVTVGDTVTVDISVDIEKGAIFIAQKDVDIVRDKVAQFLVDTFEWLPTKEQIKGLIKVRERELAKQEREISHLNKRVKWLEPKAEMLAHIIGLVCPEDENDG